jgi:Carboxypeptidase regulatory-like domain
MRYRLPLFTLLILTFCVIGSQSSAQDPAPPQKALYQRKGDEASLTGTINFKGAIPKPVRIDMSADPVCQDLDGDPKTEDVVVNENKLTNVFVYVKNRELFQAYRFEEPDTQAVLEHRACRYVPRVLGLRVGQPFSIVNADSTHHNTHPTPRLNPEWNQTQPPGAPPLRKAFHRPEVLIPFKCNQHPWERAYVAVMDHPFFAVSDTLGNYEIRGLPHGTYTLVVWHEQLGEQEVEITLVAGETRRVDFTFEAKKKG